MSAKNDLKVNFPKLIIVFLAVDWPIFSRRPMLKALAESVEGFGTTVVAINRPLCPFSTPFRKPQRIPELFKRPELITLGPNLHVYSPKYFLHDKIAGRIPLVESLDVLALRRSLKFMQKRLGIEEPAPIVWYYYPRQGYVSHIFPDSVAIYELYDSLSDIYGSYDARVLRDEARWRGSVDLLLATSPALLARHGAGYRNARYLRNGLSLAAYDALSEKHAGSGDLLERIPRPRLGYAGAGFDRLNWELILQLSDSRPDWSFVFAGRVTQQRVIDLMASKSNIHYLGELPQDQIPQVVGQFDVGLMPYLDTEFFHFLNPLKFYEHCAAGIPSVSSPIEILNHFPSDVVTVCKNYVSEWMPAIETALQNRTAEIERACRDVARKHLWEDITNELIPSLELAVQARAKSDDRLPRATTVHNDF